MKSIVKILLLSLIVFLSSRANGQGMDARIEIEHNDSMKVTLILKNISDKSVKLRMANGFHAQYNNGDESYGWSHCFRVYEHGNILEVYAKERTPDAFVIIEPGEEIKQTFNASIGWICRGMPPEREWNLNVLYHREITPEDNYYHFKSYYTGLEERIPVDDAWTGTITSNKVEVHIN